jgi:hypothetical protein
VNGPQRFWRSTRTYEHILARNLLRQDCALEISERSVCELATLGGGDEPLVVRTVALGTTHPELMPASGAANGCTPPADECVIELVLCLAPLALNVHRLVAQTGADPRRARFQITPGECCQR